MFTFAFSCIHGACFGVSVVICLDFGCQLSKNGTSRVLLKPCLLFVYFHFFLFYLGLVLVILCVSFVKKRHFEKSSFESCIEGLFTFCLLLLVSCLCETCFGVWLVPFLDFGCHRSKNGTSKGQISSVLIKACLLFVYFCLFLVYFWVCFVCISVWLLPLSCFGVSLANKG